VTVERVCRRAPEEKLLQQHEGIRIEEFLAGDVDDWCIFDWVDPFGACSHAMNDRTPVPDPSSRRLTSQRHGANIVVGKGSP
jgi:hypothetical protein